MGESPIYDICPLEHSTHRGLTVATLAGVHGQATLSKALDRDRMIDETGAVARIQQRVASES